MTWHSPRAMLAPGGPDHAVGTGTGGFRSRFQCQDTGKAEARSEEEKVNRTSEPASLASGLGQADGNLELD